MNLDLMVAAALVWIVLLIPLIVSHKKSKRRRK